MSLANDLTIRAGTLRKRLTLQQKGTRSDDGAGGGAIGFTDVATVWGAVRPLIGNELFQRQQFNPKITHEVVIRYYPGIKPSWRIMEGTTRAFDIKSVEDIEERHRQVHLICEELLAW